MDLLIAKWLWLPDNPMNAQSKSDLVFTHLSGIGSQQSGKG
jgi:hypothetical protein